MNDDDPQQKRYGERMCHVCVVVGEIKILSKKQKDQFDTMMMEVME